MLEKKLLEDKKWKRTKKSEEDFTRTFIFVHTLTLLFAIFVMLLIAFAVMYSASETVS